VYYRLDTKLFFSVSWYLTENILCQFKNNYFSLSVIVTLVHAYIRGHVSAYKVWEYSWIVPLLYADKLFVHAQCLLSAG